MISEKKAANAMGGKTARECDGCLRKRARWYCAADDAFLCQGCDASVHSANQLACRHERVRLEGRVVAPVWHPGFTRKARTPRPNKAVLLQQAKDEREVFNSNEPLVPEIGSEEGSLQKHNTEEELLYQVPVFDPFALDVGCDIAVSERNEAAALNVDENIIVNGCNGQDGMYDLDDLHGFLPSDIDLAEFAADVESFLGSGLDEDSSNVKELGLLECKEENDHTDVCFGEKIAVKVKDEEKEGGVVVGSHFDPRFLATRETLNWNFDYESPLIGEDEQKVPVPQADSLMMNSGCKSSELKKNVSLKLNYEAVITAWASQGCPWTTGNRPEFNTNNCWPDCTGSCCKDVHDPYGGLLRCHMMRGCADGGREARVSRYREKRRTRLFSKKIRYEVRKLNAEKRPRIKGRFVKRAPFAGTCSFPYSQQIID